MLPFSTLTLLPCMDPDPSSLRTLRRSLSMTCAWCPRRGVYVCLRHIKVLGMTARRVRMAFLARMANRLLGQRKAARLDKMGTAAFGEIPQIGIGGAIGVACILLDEGLKRSVKWISLPPLAVGLGIYLPTSTTLMVVVGALVGAWFNHRADRAPKPEATKQLGTLLASGLIVGESLLGVIFAAIVAFSGNASPIALVPASFETASLWIGGIVFAVTVIVLYRWIARMARD